MLNWIIPYSFYLLFFLTPLFWSSLNYELFEYNKMILVYGFTVIIVGAWLLKIINQKSLIFNRTPLDIPLLLFLGANILSTIFSIDPHTSIWGYYSRSNGGLLSLISYLLLYWAFVSNMDLPKAKVALKFGLASGFIISVWAVLEHFGVSPSCIILRNEFNDSCWVQDVQARVFATLGQPNWLAVYLAMLIFPALYFFLTTAEKWSRSAYYLLLITYYLAFTFTYSRGPTLGLIGGMVMFLAAAWRIGILRYKDIQKKNLISPSILASIILVSFFFINLLFGSALTSFRLVSKFAAPARPGISIPPPAGGSPSGTQLENGGTESGQIRLIVWKGALDIFKHYPIFGSGLETFAYSYYQYRPVEHNLTSEWDFLYNKAHNEYLNYLATTGIVGFGAYMLVIGAFIYWSVKSILHIKKKDASQFPYILLSALLAAYISYLIYNFFLFSVVIIAAFFYLFPAVAFVATEAVKPLKSSSFLLRTTNYLLQTICRRPLYTKIAKGVIIFSALFFIYSIFQLWYADTLFARGEQAANGGNPGKAYNLLAAAAALNKSEPFYKSELGFAAAQAAAALQETDATLSAQLKDEAIFQTEEVLKSNPKNVSFLRTAVRTYFELSIVDKKYLSEALQALDRSIKLAPTDPKLFYNKALILDSENQKTQEIKTLQEAIKLKHNYLEALAQLKEATQSAKP